MEKVSDVDVLVIGEALIDIIDTGSWAVEHVGGSPANVALGLGRRGVGCALLTQLGDDPRGAMIVEHLRESNVHVLPESFVLGHTSTAVARIALNGQAHYEFDVSWEPFPPPRSVHPRALHVGSVSAFMEPGASSVRQAVEEAQVDVITFDPNIRPALMPPHDQAVHIFETTASLATAVKMSDEDAAWLYPDLTMDELIGTVFDMGPDLVAITMGSRGALVASRQAQVRVPAADVVAVDTIGAGDTFMASVIHSLLASARPMEQTELEQFAVDAVRAAAITVARAGADLPWEHELDALEQIL
jgi:fructokinase